MRVSRTAMVCLLAAAFVTGLLGVESSADVVPVWLVNGSQNGWRLARLYGAKADFSAITQPCKGSPGPSPVGHFYMQSTGVSEGDPGQAWLGTDIYNGTLLSNITTLKYWTIMDYRGVETAPTLTDQLDQYGNGIPMSPTEWTTSYFPCEPIQLYLFVKLADGSLRTLIYRPWSTPGNPGFGPTDGSLCRMWQEWDCLHQGYWLQEEGPLQANTWSQILNQTKFQGAYLCSPTYSATPYWGAHECPVSNGGNPQMGCSVCFELGARMLTNDDFPSAYTSWWRESYGALGALDKFTIAGVDAYNYEFREEYDFQAPGTRLRDPFYNKIRALNNSGIFSEDPWVPEKRSRGGSPSPTWGGYFTQNYAYLMNALQRAGNYNYDTPIIGRNPDGSAIPGYNRGHLFVLYGRVSNTNGDFFKVDDGSGKMVDCYCPHASTKSIASGQYVRMVGTIYGQSPFDWYFNMFHVVTWNADPSKYVYSHMWPWRFDTYTWNVDVLQP